MKRRITKVILLVFVYCLTFPVFSQDEEEFIGYIPSEGFVPNAETAISIAIAVWKPVYGQIIKGPNNYEASLKNDVWIVTEKVKLGFFSSSKGEAYMEIDKKSGQILKMYFTK